MRKAIPKIQTDDPNLNRVQDQILAALNPLLREIDQRFSEAASPEDRLLPTGACVPFGGALAPAGFLLCDGSTVSRLEYAALFAVIGTAFGTGDGGTTFNLPDGRGRSFIGAGQGSGLTSRVLGVSGGAETHQLTANEMPSHTHPLTSVRKWVASGGTHDFPSTGLPTAAREGEPTGSVGSDAAHNNMQPYLAMNWIIKT